MKEVRIDWINNDMVIVATDRAKRPKDNHLMEYEIQVNKEYEVECPFCRGNEKKTPKDTFKIEDENGWIVRSTNNKFPIVDDIPGDIYGIHEVMIDTYRHNGSFYNMSKVEFENLFKMYKDRYENLIKDTKIKYVSVFKNFLSKAGASLDHPHSQIISLSIIPPEIENEISIAKEYYDKNNSCIYLDVIDNEIKFEKRIVHNNDKFLVIVPYVTKYTGEIRVILKEKIRFEELNDIHIKELSSMFNKLFKNLYKVNGYSPFNLCIHTHPINIESEKYFNLHMHIYPRKYSFGGFELGSGIYVSSINPDEFAQKIRF
ncbi:galactose-1-phosphate uridylyltransferase [Romboutsia sp.]|uniref:galactose-1-phosphate uridylyltransferase n=1 Tax=Romboutsia sp. TaxID=1965302 RepID=UPI003F3C089E